MKVAVKVVVLTCNWNAYSGLEAAGAERIAYPPGVYVVKVACLGQVNPGLILKAFESGIEGVLMLGCPPDKCQFEFGNRHAESVYLEAKDLVSVLGCSDSQLKLDSVAAGEGQDLVDKVHEFLDGLNGKRSQT